MGEPHVSDRAPQLRPQRLPRPERVTPRRREQVSKLPVRADSLVRPEKEIQEGLLAVRQHVQRAYQVLQVHDTRDPVGPALGRQTHP